MRRSLGSQNTARRTKMGLVEILNFLSHKMFKGQDNNSLVGSINGTWQILGSYFISKQVFKVYKWWPLVCIVSFCLQWYTWRKKIRVIYSFKITECLVYTSKRNKIISEANYWGFHLEENSMICWEVWRSHCTCYHMSPAVLFRRRYSSCPGTKPTV